MNELLCQTLQRRSTRVSNHLQMSLWLCPIHIPFTLQLINNRYEESSAEARRGENVSPRAPARARGGLEATMVASPLLALLRVNEADVS